MIGIPEILVFIFFGGLIFILVVALTASRTQSAGIQVSGELRKIAKAQRYLLTSILIILMIIVALKWIPFDSLDPKTAKRIVMLAHIVRLSVTIIATVCLFQLTRLLYSLGTSLLSILVMIFPVLIPVGSLIGWEIAIPGILLLLYPILNLIVLLVVNGRATGTLRGNGIAVGIFGVNPARMNEIRED